MDRKALDLDRLLPLKKFVSKVGADITGEPCSAKPENTKGGSITVPLTFYLTGLG